MDAKIIRSFYVLNKKGERFFCPDIVHADKKKAELLKQSSFDNIVVENRNSDGILLTQYALED